MSLTIEQLRIECEKVREAGKCVHEAGLIVQYRNKQFPKAWCGVLSRVLGAQLSKKYPMEQFFYVWGERIYSGSDWMSHAWISYGDLILDITADQFEEVREKILILPERESVFHSSFSIVGKHQVERDVECYYEEGLVMGKLKERENKA